MTITLTIDNADSLPDGGPVRFQVRNRGFEIGRDTHLDWTLPDPARYVSGRHCEVRFENGGYWLYDVSSNGTYLNGAMQRMKSPYRLADGDRLAIGHYIIIVAVAPGESEAPREAYADPAPAGSSGMDNIWDVGGDVPSPVDRRQFMPEPERRRAPDFSEQFLDFPAITPMPVPPGQPLPPTEEREAVSFEPAPLPFPAAPGGPEPQVQSPFGPVSAVEPMPAVEGFPVPQPMPVVQPMPAPPVEMQPQPFPTAPPAAAPFEAPAFPAVRPLPAGTPPTPARAAPAAAGQGNFIAALAAGAGVPADIFQGRDPNEVAYEVGEFVKASVENLAQLLRARAAAKTMTKSSSRTMISAADNNPLKFIPVPAEAIEIMFARRRPGYLGARRSVEEAFEDLKRHELATYTAMQKALGKLLDDFSPETIEAKAGSSTFSSKKARAWEVFVRRWEDKHATDNGMLDVFLAYFAEAYDEANRKK